PILLTPFTGDWNIEAAPLKELVDATFREAGLAREDVDTGAVIITGEAARRENARKIAELFSDETGRFVCATAGPALETVMAAHGSGAVLKSREEGLTILNIDVGGGTTKVSVIDNGRIRVTAALNVGARLVAYDDGEILTRLEKAGRRFLGDLGHNFSIGTKLEGHLRHHLAARMARVLFDAVAGGTPPWNDLYVTAPLSDLPRVDGILFSGGVSEYIYSREVNAFGDLGPDLGREIRKEATERGFQ